MVLARPYFCICCLLAIHISLLSQEITNKFNIQRFNSNQGLSNNLVETIFQDYKGYIWLGTIDGLSQFDRTRFKTYRNRSEN